MEPESDDQMRTAITADRASSPELESMTQDNEFRRRRDGLSHLGIVEHHLIRDRTLGVFDICERLIPVEDTVLEIAKSLSLDRVSAMKVNDLVTQALGQSEGSFEREDKWLGFISGLEDAGGFGSDPMHASGWVFSALYWDHFTECRFASAWFFTNAMRIKHQASPLQLAPQKIGPFLDSLSGSGPPVFDGQTFFPDEYGP